MHPAKKISLIATIGAALAAPLAAFAAYDAGSTGLTATASQAGLGATPADLSVVIGTVIKTALGVVGVVFLVLMVYAGYIWMIARGDEAKVEKAKDTIVNCIIGIVIVVGAYAITSFIVNALAKPVSTSTTPTTCPNGATPSSNGTCPPTT